MTLSTSTTTPLLPAAAPADRPLTAADRCDRCCAQAKVRVQLRAGDLLFCGHHSARFAAPIAAALVAATGESRPGTGSSEPAPGPATAAQSTSGDPDR